MPEISCVMPTRNRANFIGETIESIINQTFTDWELIIVDDHSDVVDNTEKIVSKFKNNKINYFRLPDANGIGIASARNFGTMMAKGKYIAVTDSDDICYPDRLELTIQEFKKKKTDLVYSDIDMWYEDSGRVVKRSGNYSARVFDLNYFKKFDFIPHPTVAYQRIVALDFPYNSYFRRAEDYDFISRLYKYGFKFSFIPKSLVKYRIHENSITMLKSDGIHYSQKVRESREWI